MDFDFLFEHKSMFDANDTEMYKNATNNDWTTEHLHKYESTQPAVWDIKVLLAIHMYNTEYRTSSERLIRKWVDHYNEE